MNKRKFAKIITLYTNINYESANLLYEEMPTEIVNLLFKFEYEKLSFHIEAVYPHNFLKLFGSVEDFHLYKEQTQNYVYELDNGSIVILNF
jgi:hypothetical protein